MLFLKIIGITLLIVLGLVAIYILSGLVLPYIPINRKADIEPDTQIYLKSDGIHSDFILPVVNDLFDWRKIIDISDFKVPINENTYFAFGWGDRGFYMEIPEWSDLTFKIAFKAMCLPSPTCMHLAAIDKLPTDFKYFTGLHISRKQYEEICNYILSYFRYEDEKPILIPDYSMAENDLFYESPHSYHAFNTCNQWVNKGMANAEIKTAYWSPAGFGLFLHKKKFKIIKTKHY